MLRGRAQSLDRASDGPPLRKKQNSGAKALMITICVGQLPQARTLPKDRESGVVESGVNLIF